MQHPDYKDGLEHLKQFYRQGPRRKPADVEAPRLVAIAIVCSCGHKHFSHLSDGDRAKASV